MNHCYALLRGALAWALRQELVGRNVADAVEAPSVPRGTAVALNVDEANAVLTAGDDNALGAVHSPRTRLRSPPRGATRPALNRRRSGEQRTHNPGIALPNARRHRREDHEDRSRSHRCFARTRDRGASARVTQAQERLAAGSAFVDSGHVFQGPLGGTIRPYTATDAFRKLARKVGISTTKLHALRHTTGTWLIASGVDPRTTASVLGHASPTITLSIYSHLVVGMQKAAVAHIDDRLNAATAKNKKR